MQTQSDRQTPASRGPPRFRKRAMAPWKGPRKVALFIINAGFVCYLVYLLQEREKERLDSLQVRGRFLRQEDSILQRLDSLGWNMHNLCE